jgi:Fe-S cluster assembly protein SufD
MEGSNYLTDKVTRNMTEKKTATVSTPLPQREGEGVGLQYVDLYEQSRELICKHSSAVMNAVREEAFREFSASGFPTRKVERYKYTDINALFAPDYGLNLNRFDIPVNPYDAFRCDVPNLSTSLYFVVNDMFYTKALPKSHLPEGVIIGSLKDFATTTHYHQLASKDHDAVTNLNTMLAQDGLYVYVPKGVVVDRAIQVINILKSPANLTPHSTLHTSW